MHELPVTIHMMVKNEDRFVWYALASVLPYAQKILITDTGSTDNTLAIIKSFKTKKIELEQIKVDKQTQIAQVRQRHIEKTETDWIWIVDGDEVYPNAVVEEIGKIINKKESVLEGIVVGRLDLLGDIYHHQDDSAGCYDLWGKRGHFALRLISKKNIEGLHVEGMYPYEGYYDDAEIEIIHHKNEKFAFTNGKLFHAMYLNRSSKGARLRNVFHRNKYKIEKGMQIELREVPEVFFQEHPKDVADVTKKRSFSYEIAARVITPIKKVKRFIF